MIQISIVLSALLFHFLALISPGPDFVMAVQSGLSLPRRKALMTALGFGAGIAIHITYCAIGVGYIVSQSIIVFNILKTIGGIYLMWIAVQLLRSQGIKAAANASKDQSTRAQAFKRGFLTNVLNPKATLFMVSLFALVLTPTTSLSTIIIASVGMVVATIIWFSIVISFVSYCKDKVARYSKIIDRVSGLALIVLSIKLLLARQH